MHDTAPHGTAVHGTAPISHRITAAAAVIGVSRRLMYRLIEIGEIQAIRISDGVQVVEHAELQRFLERKKSQTQAA